MFPKKCALSFRIGPPKVADHCWSEYGTTTCSTGSALLNLLSRKLPRNDPEGLLVPDLVIAFTCTPDDRPCVASNRFEMNWNSAMASRLYLAWLPVPRFAVTGR